MACRGILQQPHVLYPALVGVLGFAAAAAFGPSLMFLVPAIAGTLIGGGGWALDYFLRRNQHASRCLQGIRETLSGRRDQTIQELMEELGEGVKFSDFIVSMSITAECRTFISRLPPSV